MRGVTGGVYLLQPYSGNKTRVRGCKLKLGRKRGCVLKFMLNANKDGFEGQKKPKVDCIKFFVSNLLKGCTPWEVSDFLGVFGEITGVYIARKKDKVGNTFGFISFKNVKDGKELERHLQGVKMGGCKLHINIAKFAAENEGLPVTVNRKKETVKPGYHSQKVGRMESTSKWGGDRSFKEALMNQEGPSISKSEEGIEKVIDVPEETMAFKELLFTSLVGRVKEFMSLTNLKSLCRSCGGNIGIKYLGGMVWIWEEPGDWIPDSLDEDPTPWLTGPGIDESVSTSREPGNEESLGKEDDQVEEGEIVTSYPEVVAEQVHVHGEKVDLAANQEGTEEVSDLKSVANHDVPFTGMGNRNFQKKVIRRNSYKLGKAHPKKAASPAEERPKKRLRSALEDDLFGLDKIMGLGPVRSQSPQIYLRVKEPIGVVERGGDKGDLCSAADRNPSEVLDKEIEAMIGIGRVVGSDMQEFPQLIRDCLME
ncbi:hypothetical protein L1987_31569 [Smallanthus sonchifolius]|uniref:Uncharacterized protein n=1 Tax=Smallanthus sonchifolius TaxID=185202 RepID=A0ACB9I763_9ASTR|nr:hypothetical protein L1987_31569 [Smallanthus sonchifolius]